MELTTDKDLLTLSSASAQHSIKKAYDILFIGAGFRVTTFIASNPHLLSKKICIVESSPTFGPGSFSNFSLNSSSNGSRFFRHVDPLGEFGWIYSNPITAEVANAKHPVPIHQLSIALTELGEKISSRIGSHSVLLNRRVEDINVDPNLDYPIKIKLNSGKHITSKVCVLGTGRIERTYPLLRNYSDKLWLSSRFLSIKAQQAVIEQLYQMSSKTICILGCSHSAFSVLHHLLKVVERIKESNSLYIFPKIIILHRKPVRVCYSSLENAVEEQATYGSEEDIDIARDVCPTTGIVFRDTGLRHISKELYYAVKRGSFSYVKMQIVKSLNTSHKFFNESDMIIQALGYKPRVPNIKICGKLYRSSKSGESLRSRKDGFLDLPGIDNSCHIAEIRVNSTPRSLRDHGNYAMELYKTLGDKIFFVLTEH